MKILFLGTPSFGVPALKEILMSRHEVLGVVCQPDKVGNHNKVTICDVKRFAIENNIKVYQFDRISRDGLETVQNIAPDLILTAAFGQILSQKVLDIPKFGVINIHGSILPKLRGAAPIQRAIIDGNTTTGITIMKTVYAVDAGDVLAQETIEIGENETSGELFMRMSQLASKMIVPCLDAIENGTAVFTPQKAEDATFCSKITAE
ncbi:MAG: methionyl-tRNA formyltransferase, partial [Clostridia bacterium]